MTWKVFDVAADCRSYTSVPEVAGGLTFALADAKVPGVVAVAPSNAVISNPQSAVVVFGSLTVTVSVCGTPGV